MIDFIVNNISTIAVFLALCIIVGLIIIKMVKNKKAGKKSCSCGCSGCPMKDTCHQDK